MADAGVKTTELPPQAQLDEVLGNRDGSTVLVPVDDLAQGFLGAGPIAAKLAVLSSQITSGSVSQPTWAELAAIVPTQDGTGGEVLETDVGTHTDPVTAATVNNSGSYAWRLATPGWERIADVGLAGKLNKAANLGDLDDPSAARTNLDVNSKAEASAALLLKAALDSPEFTGAPLAPTAVNATNNGRIATTAFVHALLLTLVENSPATLDTFNELAAALGDDPNFATTIFSALATKAAINHGHAIDDTAGLSQALATQTDSIDGLRTEIVPDTVDRSGVLFAIVDELTKRMALSVDRAGHVWIAGEDATDFFQNQAGLAGLLSSFAQAPSRSGYSLAFTDSLKRIAFGVSTAGHFLVEGTDLNDLLRTDIPAQFAAVSAALTSNRNIWGGGDSLMEGAGGAWDETFPHVLAGLLDAGQTVTNAGIGGQTSAQIAARMGGVPVLIDLSGGEIPESASAVVTTISIELLTTPATTAARTVTGWLDGVYGTLNKDTSDVYHFQRTVAADDPHPLPAEAVFELEVGALQDQTAIIWAGRNDNLTTSADAAFDNVVAMVDNLRPVNPHFVILSILNADDEPSGSADYNALMAFNRRLKIKYPRNYLDMRALLIQAHNSGLPSDVTDAANDIPPGSLRSDAVHLNAVGYALVAQTVKNFLDNKGW